MIHWVELVVFGLLFAVVSVMGFLASRWRRAETLEHLDEWGLGGRKFGAWITWFLIGGDIYTAYTFVAVPALLFGAGAMGFFALPYTVILYPAVFLLETVRQSVGRAVDTAPDGWWEIAAIRRLKLRRPMLEGHRLDLQVALTPADGSEPALTAAVAVRHGDRPVAEMSLRLEPGASR